MVPPASIDLQIALRDPFVLEAAFLQYTPRGLIFGETRSLNPRKIERFKAGKGCGMAFPIITVRTRPTGEAAVPCTRVQYHENEPDKEALVKLTMQGTGCVCH